MATSTQTSPRHPVSRAVARHAGGLAATVVVVIPLEALEGRLVAASLDTGEGISPGLARLLACEAGLIPVVLGGPSEVLDVGRKARFHTTPMRIAMTIRDAAAPPRAVTGHPASATPTTPPLNRNHDGRPTDREPTAAATKQLNHHRR
jgi:hypothetical protein